MALGYFISIYLALRAIWVWDPCSRVFKRSHWQIASNIVLHRCNRNEIIFNDYVFSYSYICKMKRKITDFFGPPPKQIVPSQPASRSISIDATQPITTSADEKSSRHSNPQSWFGRILSIPLQIFATLPVTTACGERSFSALKYIKTYLRSSMKEDRLDAFSSFIH